MLSDTELAEYYPLARVLAFKLYRRLPRKAGIDIHDLISVAYLGLVKANQRYKPQKGKAFKAYVWIRINGEMLDYLRNEDLRARYLHNIKPLSISSLNAPVKFEQSSEGDTTTPTGLDVLESHYFSPLDALLIKDRSDRMQAAINTLNERDVSIFNMYLYEAKTMEEIAKIVGLAESRISQIVTRSLPKLKELMCIDGEVNAKSNKPKGNIRRSIGQAASK
jgi:RNA polymerase sigma factor for flagellar operon FliA